MKQPLNECFYLLLLPLILWFPASAAMCVPGSVSMTSALCRRSCQPLDVWLITVFGRCVPGKVKVSEVQQREATGGTTGGGG